MEDKKDLNFEETMQELENIVQELEKGNLNLDDSIKKFEKGMDKKKKISNYLEEAEKKITILVKGKDGELEEQEF